MVLKIIDAIHVPNSTRLLKPAQTDPTRSKKVQKGPNRPIINFIKKRSAQDYIT